MKSDHRVVIIGGGFAGLNAARALNGAPVTVTLIDRRNFHLFQPLLYQVATAALSPANIASPLRYILKRQRNAHVLLGEVTDVDLQGRRIITREGDLPFDSLVVAPGSDNNFFGHEEWARHAPGLKSLEDAIEIRRKVLLAFESAEKETDPAVREALLTFVVVGAGPTGVELAGALAEISRDTLAHEFRSVRTTEARILLLDSVSRVLPPYPEVLSAKAEAALRRLGVEFCPGAVVTSIDADGITIKRGGEDRRIPTRTVLWAAGVKASPLGAVLAKAAGVALGRGGKLGVRPDLTLPGYPNVYVIGDLALVAGDGGAPLPGTAPVAMQEGRYAAEAIKARLRGATPAPFRYFHKGDMATIGRQAAVADVWGLRFNGTLAWLAWLFIHLWYIAEFEDRILVFLQWAWNYVTRNRSARLITR